MLRRRAALFVLLCAPSFGGCCGGDEYLTLGIGLQGPAGITTPDWGGTMESTPLPYFTATFSQDSRPKGEVFELFLDGARVPLIVEEIPWAANPDKAGSCSHDEQGYEPEAPLAPGIYKLAHRRRNGNGRRLNCQGECPWTDLDGEPALELALVVPAGDAVDGGAEGGL